MGGGGKQRITLNESQLNRVIRESIGKVLNEYTLGRGINTNRDYDSVPYDDDYIERYGNEAPMSYEDKSENGMIEKYASGMCERIERIMKMQGYDCNVTVTEDREYGYNQEYNDDYDYRTLDFSIDLRDKKGSIYNKNYNWKTWRTKALSLVAKIFNNFENVRGFNIGAEYTFANCNYLTINVTNVMIIPDKNGMEVVPSRRKIGHYVPSKYRENGIE